VVSRVCVMRVLAGFRTGQIEVLAPMKRS
jgi:hypothetical protein